MEAALVRGTCLSEGSTSSSSCANRRDDFNRTGAPQARPNTCPCVPICLLLSLCCRSGTARQAKRALACRVWHWTLLWQHQGQSPRRHTGSWRGQHLWPGFPRRPLQADRRTPASRDHWPVHSGSLASSGNVSSFGTSRCGCSSGIAAAHKRMQKQNEQLHKLSIRSPTRTTQTRSDCWTAAHTQLYRRHSREIESAAVTCDHCATSIVYT